MPPSHYEEAVARAVCALFSDWFPSTTGEMVHVDGGYHALGAAPIAAETIRAEAAAAEAAPKS